MDRALSSVKLPIFGWCLANLSLVMYIEAKTSAM